MNNINLLDVLNQRIAAQSIQPTSSQYLSTGIAALDRCIGGIPVGQTTLVMGKDDVKMLEFLVNISVAQVQQGQFVVLFQKDQQQAALMLWCMVAKLTNISVAKLRNGQLTDQEIVLITPVFAELNRSLVIYYPEEHSAIKSSEPVVVGSDHNKKQSQLGLIEVLNMNDGYTSMDLDSLDALLGDDLDESDDYMNASLLTECLVSHQVSQNDRSMFVVLTLNAINDITQIRLYQQVINRLQGNVDHSATFLIMAERRRFSMKSSLHDVVQSGELYQLAELIMDLSVDDRSLLRTDLINVVKSPSGAYASVCVHLDRVMPYNQ